MVPSPIKAQAGSVPASDPSCPAAWFRRSRKRSRAARSTNREAHRLAEAERQAECAPPGVKPGAAVRHERFGDGIVTKLDKSGQSVRIRFEEGEKAFLYPDDFRDGFLCLKEGT